MRSIWTIARHEYRQYFSSPIAYFVAFVLFLILGIFFFLNIQIVGLQSGYVPGVEIFLAPMATLLVMITPAITTRLLAEERRLGTIELLLTAPIRDWELVVGKWLGGFFLILTIVFLTLIFPIILNQLVDPGVDQGPLVSGYLGIILLCASLVAVGVAVSSFFSNQIAAFVTTLGVFVFMWWMIGPIAQVMGPAGNSTELISYLDYSDHYFRTFFRGIIDVRDVVYYVSLTVLALFTATMSIEMRRWK